MFAIPHGIRGIGRVSILEVVIVFNIRRDGVVCLIEDIPYERIVIVRVGDIPGLRLFLDLEDAPFAVFYSVRDRGADIGQGLHKCPVRVLMSAIFVLIPLPQVEFKHFVGGGALAVDLLAEHQVHGGGLDHVVGAHMPLSAGMRLFDSAAGDQPAFAGSGDRGGGIFPGHQEHADRFVDGDVPRVHAVEHDMLGVFALCFIAIGVSRPTVHRPMDLVQPDVLGGLEIEDHDLVFSPVDVQLAVGLPDGARQRVAVQVDGDAVRQSGQIDIVGSRHKRRLMRGEFGGHGASVVDDRIDDGIGDLPGRNGRDGIVAVALHLSGIRRIGINQAGIVARNVHRHHAFDMGGDDGAGGSRAVIGLGHIRLHGRTEIRHALVRVHGKVGLQVAGMIQPVGGNAEVDAGAENIRERVIAAYLDLVDLHEIGIDRPGVGRIRRGVVADILFRIANHIGIITMPDERSGRNLAVVQQHAGLRGFVAGEGLVRPGRPSGLRIRQGIEQHHRAGRGQIAGIGIRVVALVFGFRVELQAHVRQIHTLAELDHHPVFRGIGLLQIQGRHVPHGHVALGELLEHITGDGVGETAIRPMATRVCITLHQADADQMRFR